MIFSTLKKRRLSSSRNSKVANPSFLSLPDEIVLNCLARISRSYYPKLSLVCKTFCSLIKSYALTVERLRLQTLETLVHVYLQLPYNPRPTMFTLWIKPGQILTNQLEKEERSTGDTRLVQAPSSYNSSEPMYVTEEELFWRKTINMTVARTKPSAYNFNGKIYVMGGCGADESENWGEVFDIKTQTWEPLPDPGAELRFSSIRKIEVIQEKLYVRSNEKNESVYDPKEGKWENPRCGMIETANYDGKLLLLWDKFVHHLQDKDIWGAMIALERREGSDEVWGNVEWANVVLTVPSSYVFTFGLRNRV
ncbi:hypothetical protein CARUB_v10003824mg [Capsella rubella]|uniref:F-box domain-containing protein n=1 Tax=Capsella rubella TaxID=81985 RepID=R0H1G7_9BRAS|nr:hypothetical protein CARUB_v10003824mg [Capsella rubella]